MAKAKIQTDSGFKAEIESPTPIHIDSGSGTGVFDARNLSMRDGYAQVVTYAEKEVEMVSCHQAVNIPLVANEKTVSDHKYKGIRMVRDAGTGDVKWTVKDKSGWIPSANIAVGIYK